MTPPRRNPLGHVSSETLHASCVAIGGRAVLIEGRSGAGKSDLALRLIDRGARLVSDDYTLCRRQGATLVASPPANIAGRIEVRGLGLIDLPHDSDVAVALVVTVTESPDRLPLEARERRVADVALPVIELPALEPSAAIKVEMALARV